MVGRGACILVAMLFLAGIVFGAVAVKALGDDQKAELLSYVDALMRGVTRYTEPVKRGAVLQASVLNNLKTAAATWFLGVTVIGMPLVMAIVFTRGFVLGFTVSFLVEELGYRGLLLSAAAVLPHNLLAVPALLSLGMMSLSFSFTLVASAGARRGIDFLSQFTRYSLWAMVLTAVILLSSGIEAIVTPSILGVVGSRMM
jgi:stage II sporulation protein M